MKTNKFFLTFCVLFIMVLSLNAQHMFYYYNGTKVNLTIDRSTVNIITDDATMSSSVLQNIGTAYRDSVLTGNFTKVNFTSIPNETQYSEVINTLRQNLHVKKVLPYFVRTNATPIGTSDIFYVKLKNTNDVNLLQYVAQQQNVQIVKQVPYMPLWYIMSIKNSNFQNSVEASNYFYETENFDNVDPAFMFNFRTNCVNDPLFNQQWGLYNSTNTDFDVNACDAWAITRGAGVNIAVIDNGIDMNHNDLSANMHPLSFDCQSGTSPSQFINGGSHGTHVAGIFGAIRNNNLQVVGISPEAKIMGISHDLMMSSTYSAEMASGFAWAMQNGADIITNSWGDWGGEMFDDMHSTVLESAIIDVITNGRGGKGCIVTFAAGNVGTMDYPGNFNSDILTVGAIDINGQRAIFNGTESSGYGTELDIVAPGKNILSTLPNNKTGIFSGTSMACPHVAGVAALILSVNPNLTGQQVRDIIESTAQKIRAKNAANPNELYEYTTTQDRPNGTWNNQMGYGLVDAYAAVQATKETLPKYSDLMIKDDPLDDGTEPNPRPVSWNSPDIKIIDEYGNEIFPCRINSDKQLFVNIKVRNIGNAPSPAGAKLNVAWGIPQLVQNFSNQHCNACGTYTTLDLGGIIAKNYLLPSIPAKDANGDGIFEVSFPFRYPLQEYVQVLEPQIDSRFRINWGFAILAGVSDQPFNVLTPSNSTRPNVELAARNSNNLAVDNGKTTVLFNDCFVNVVMLEPEVVSGNPFVINYNQLLTGSNYTLNDFAELNAVLSNDLMAKLNKKASKDIKLIDENTVLLTSAKSELVFNPLNDDGIYFIGAAVHFISDKMPELNEFQFDIALSSSGQTLGTVPFTAVRDADVYFKAHAEASKTKIVRGKEEATLTSNTITDDATYTWLDEGKNIIGDGTQLTVSPSVGQNFTIEIQKEDDGFKSYGEVGVIVVDGVIKSLSPNPAQNNVTVNYLLADDVTNATIQIANIFGNVQVSLPLSTTQEQQDISLLGLVSGNYIVQLVINGFVVDSQSLIIK